MPPVQADVGKSFITMNANNEPGLIGVTFGQDMKGPSLRKKTVRPRINVQ